MPPVYQGYHHPAERWQLTDAPGWIQSAPYNSFADQHPMNTVCKHPRVRVVAREDDVEFVECLDCGEVFDSNEFRDMAIEEMQDEEEEEETA
jgi:hypothetical protein